MSTYGMSCEFVTGAPMHETNPTKPAAKKTADGPFQTKTATPETLTETLNQLQGEGCQIHTIYVSKTYGSSGTRSAAELTIVYLQGTARPTG